MSKFLSFGLCYYLGQGCLTSVVIVSLGFGLACVENYWLLLCVLLWSILFVSVLVSISKLL